MSLDWNRITFLVALVVVGVLVGLDKLPQTALLAILGWLLPSPVKPVSPLPTGAP